MVAPTRARSTSRMRRRTTTCALGLIISTLLIAFCEAASGQAVLTTLELPVTLGYPGGEVVMPVALESTHAIVGFSLGVTHDSVALSLTSVEAGSAFATDAGIFLVNLSPDGGPGFTLGVLVDADLTPPFTFLSAGVVHEIVVVRYSVLAAAPEGNSLVEFTEALGNPPVELLVAVENRAGTPSESPITPISGAVTVTFSTFRRGDATDDGSVNLLDVLRTLELIFLPLGGIECFDVLDVNDNGSLGVADALYLLEYLFLQTVPPPAVPFSTCGIDPSEDALPCGGIRSACP